MPLKIIKKKSLEIIKKATKPPDQKKISGKKQQ